MMEKILAVSFCFTLLPTLLIASIFIAFNDAFRK